MQNSKLLSLIGIFAAIAFAATVAGQEPAVGRGAGAQGGGRGRGGVPTIPGQNPNGMHIYIRAGLKTHGEGLHDYPQFLADWSKLLTTRYGAVVDGSLHAPTAAEIEKTDVIIFYKGDAGYMSDTEKADLDAYVKRGGGIVSFHDSLCGPDPEYFASLVGGGKKHGETNFSAGSIQYNVADKNDPIVAGVPDFAITDEAFFLMTWPKSPPIHALINGVIPDSQSAGTHKGEVVPQMWTYEHTVPGGAKPARAFVWMQGHQYKNFTDPKIEPMLVRGIAWAAGRPVDELIGYTPAAPRGRGRQ